jgi:hypothetical protein
MGEQKKRVLPKITEFLHVAEAVAELREQIADERHARLEDRRQSRERHDSTLGIIPTYQLEIRDYLALATKQGEIIARHAKRDMMALIVVGAMAFGTAVALVVVARDYQAHARSLTHDGTQAALDTLNRDLGVMRAQIDDQLREQLRLRDRLGVVDKKLGD